MRIVGQTRWGVALGPWLLGASAAAQDTTAFTWTREVITSRKLNEQRTVLVAMPPDYGVSNKRYPVVVILDAQDLPQFAAAIANVNFLASRGAIPQLIVVGVTNGRDRNRELTPPRTGSRINEAPSAGGADTFADYIADEVLPFIRAKYRALPMTVLSGHSFGGLFALHNAATRPGLYGGVIAISPALWWNDSTVVVKYSDDIAKSRAHVRIFATSGGLEYDFDITTKRFAARLDSLRPASVGFGYRHYPDDTHNLTPGLSFAEGIRFVFEPVSLVTLPRPSLVRGADSAAVVRAVLELEAAYATRARSLGLPEVLPERVLYNLGYNVLRDVSTPRMALWVFRRNAERYQQSALARFGVSDALLAQGDTAQAIKELERAVDFATRANQPVVLTESREQLDKLRSTFQAPKRTPRS